ncbi:PAS domain-containing sensor histidine kinase [Lysobacter auxotrophicus]|uniref:histidine kinase n=1 Tax=Lysobacter auxotrophicus TaxID=2992573 RepID=A0ABM8DFV4_9GAMM|nr:PAS domain-containing sensor histidine kinase [Lysobacter auxotrophicus]BDU17494.1 PAS domain-containing sensor histidine kinase [Lysobacter auxotrophicus]
MSETHPATDHIVQDMLWTFANVSSEYAVLLLDADGTINWANIGAETILGETRSGLMQGNISHYFTREDVRKGIPEHEIEEARQRGRSGNDRWMARADRSRFWASGQTICLSAHAGDRNFLKIFRDLTDGKMQLEAAMKRCHAVTQTNEGLTAAIALLAHELRNPLSGISLSATLLSAQSRDPSLKPQVESIARNVSMAARLIDDLMQHSKVTSKGFSLDRTDCSLRELLESSTRIAQRQMEQESREIPVLVPSGDIEMHIDCMRMQQVFVNLIANAIRYTPAPRKIWVTGTFIGNDVVVRVSDEGIGIEADRLERIFELFTLPHLQGSKLGLGLGLALVKKIVELHSGSVQARSEGVDKGSQFIVRFPARE